MRKVRARVCPPRRLSLHSPTPPSSADLLRRQGTVRSVLGFLPLLLSRLDWVHSCVCGRGRVWFDSSKPWGLCKLCLLLLVPSVSSCSVLPAVPGGLVAVFFPLEMYAPCFPCPPISCNPCRLGYVYVCLSAYLCGMFLMFSLAI
jgi:hypothetical protein